MRIFLSYGHDSNQTFVDRIKFDLEQVGHQVWQDKAEIKTGDDWRKSITDGIITSDLVLAFLSKHSARIPGVCLNELKIACRLRPNSIVSVLVESEFDVQPPPMLSRNHWLDMHNWQQHEFESPAWELWFRPKYDELVGLIDRKSSSTDGPELELLNQVLAPMAFDFHADPKYLELSQRSLLGRQWLFDEIESRCIDHLSTSHLIWIQGDPGIGKSLFAAHFARKFDYGATLAIHFCDWKNYQTTQEIVFELAFQIAIRVPDYRKLLLAIADRKTLTAMNPDKVFCRLIVEPLQNIADGGRENSFIIIDAIDEAKSGAKSLAQVLARNANALPDWITLVVTSRPESYVTGPLGGIDPIQISSTDSANREDIRTFISGILAPKLEQLANAQEIIAQISDASDGNFLYAETLCQEINRGNISLIDSSLFPSGLGGIYFQNFQRQFADPADFAPVRSVLEVVFAAREPISIKVLQLIFRDLDIHDVFKKLGSLFSIFVVGEKKFLKEYHKSVVDWITEDTNHDFHVNIQKGLRRLAEFCAQAPTHPEIARCGYVKRNSAMHLKNENMLAELVEAIYFPPLNIVNRWVTEGFQHEGSECLPDAIQHCLNTMDLHRASELYSQLARVMIQLGQHRAAETYLNQGLSIADQVQNADAITIINHELGSIAFYQGNYKTAIEHYKQALTIALNMDPINHVEVSANYAGLATVAKTLNKHKQAIELSTKGIESAEQGNDVFHVIANRRLRCNSLRSLLKTEDAQLEITKALIECRMNNLVHEEAELLVANGWYAYENAILNQFEFDSSVSDCFECALEVARSANHLFAQSDAILGLAWLALARQEVGLAKECLSQSVLINTSVSYKSIGLASEVVKAHILFAEGQLDAAKRSYVKTALAAKKLKKTGFQSDCNLGLFAVSRQMKRTADADVFLKVAISLANQCSPLKTKMIKLGALNIKKNRAAVPF